MESTTDPHNSSQTDDEMSMFRIGSLLLRWRRWLVLSGFLGATFWVGVALVVHRVFESTTTFIPQGSEGNVSAGLALAASQLGIRLPSTTNGWGPPIYVELLQSRALLQPIATDTLRVPEISDQHVALMDLLDVNEPSTALRIDRTIRKLKKIVTVQEDKGLGAVRLSVVTKWPSVSLELAQQLLSDVNEFNLKTRKSQATAEREFAEAQVVMAEQALKSAEDTLRAFMERNRTIGSSPTLALDRDRLQRVVSMRQTLYTTLEQDLEEARIREVRDTPVITVLEPPQLAVTGVSRRLFLKGLLGGTLGLIVAFMVALVSDGFARAREASQADVKEFFEVLAQATPGFIHRKRQ